MPDPTYQVYTFLPMEEVRRLGGIPPQAVVGLVDRRALRGGATRLTPETFRPNQVFREFLHDVLSDCLPRTEGIRAEARRLGDGYVYVIDGRTPDPTGDVPSHDIIGAVEARGGEVVPGSYQANPDHRIVTEDGLFRLSGELQACLMEAMRGLPPVSQPGA